MRVVVPDASVLLKWVLPDPKEEHQEQAMSIRSAALSGEIILKIPSLWLYEVGNTLSRHFPKQSKDLLQVFVSFGFVEPEWTELWLDKCLFLTETYQVTFYDACYHSLALLEKGVFVTADEQYVVKTSGAGAVVRLGEWTV